MSATESSATTAGCPFANLMDPALADGGLPYDRIKEIRDAGPAIKIDDPLTGVPYWAVTRKDAIDYVSKHNEIFSSALRGAPPSEMPQEEVDNIMSKMFLNMDPPDNLEYRKLIRDNFSPATVSTYQPHLAAHAKAIIDKVIDQGSCEFVEDIAAELPLLTILEFFDIPIEDRSSFFEWTNMMFFADDPEVSTTPEAGMEAAMNMMVYFSQLAAKWRGSSEKNINTQLLNGEIYGKPISDEDFCWIALMCVVAGNESTRTSISQGMRNLMENPEQYAYLQQHPEALDNAIDEILRYNGSFICMRRTATQDHIAAELGGADIKKGDKVIMYYHAANYDEAVFGKDGKNFDIRRAERHPDLSRDLRSFGYGRHNCLGMHLAKLEMKVMFTEILKRINNPKFEGEVRYMKSTFVQGIKAMPISFEKTA